MYRNLMPTAACAHGIAGRLEFIVLAMGLSKICSEFTGNRQKGEQTLCIGVLTFMSGPLSTHTIASIIKKNIHGVKPWGTVKRARDISCIGDCRSGKEEGEGYRKRHEKRKREKRGGRIHERSYLGLCRSLILYRSSVNMSHQLLNCACARGFINDFLTLSGRWMLVCLRRHVFTAASN